MATTNATNWGELFYEISPYSWAYVGIGIALGASVIGAAWYSIDNAGVSSSRAHRFSEPP